MKKIFALCFCLLGWIPSLAAAQVPRSNHVVVVVEENHSYSSVIGNSAMPYLNSLGARYGVAKQYYANKHPSIGNYFEMTSGQVITTNDSFTSTVTADNMVRHMLSAAKTWKSYAEGLPSVGYIGGDTGSYVRHHNPFSYFSDVRNSSVERLNLVPATHFLSDVNNHALPQFAFLVPDNANNGHSGSLAQADRWLKAHIAPLLNSTAFQQNGVLIIVFDESFNTDTAHGGGHVATVIVGPKVKKGYKSTLFYQHQSLLKTVLKALGLGSYPGASASASAMNDFFF
jgi:acid phosphatase